MFQQAQCLSTLWWTATIRHNGERESHCPVAKLAWHTSAETGGGRVGARLCATKEREQARRSNLRAVLLGSNHPRIPPSSRFMPHVRVRGLQRVPSSFATHSYLCPPAPLPCSALPQFYGVRLFPVHRPLPEKASLLRRGQVLHCREREWEGYGYGLLWIFVQDSPDQVRGCGYGGTSW